MNFVGEVFDESYIALDYGAIVAGLLAVAPEARSQAPHKENGPQSPPDLILPIIAEKWTGDFDGMVKRRVIRALVVYSKQFYFVERGTQRGASYEAMKLFEKFVNQKAKVGEVPVRVVFVPLRRDELIPALLDGRGDIAAANLTITPEDQKAVDFSNPILTSVSEIVVTGPTSRTTRTVDDLSGREVYVRKSSSYYESLERLNAGFQRVGKAPVRLRLAPEDLQDEDLLEMLNAGLVEIVIADTYIAKFWSQVFPNIRLHFDVAVKSAQKPHGCSGRTVPGSKRWSMVC